MGAVSQVLSTDGEDVKTSRGNEHNVTAKHFSAPGDDSHPLPEDYCALSGATGTGRQTAVGYRDFKNPSIAKPGEKRTYARDSSGTIVSQIYAKNDGSVEVSNSVGMIILLPDGTISLNGVTIPPDGSDVILATGRSLMHHQHPQGNDSGGDSEQPTGDTIP